MANFLVEDNASLSGIVAGDTLYVAGRRGGNVTNILTGLDLSGLAAGGLASVHVTRAFKANFGSESTPFKAEVNVSAASVFRNDAAEGELYYTPDGSADTCVSFRHVGPSSSHLIGSGTVTNLEQLDGLVVVGENITATTVRAAGGKMRIEGQAGTNPTTMFAGGSGDLYSARGATTINLFDAGRLTIDAGADPITTINMYSGRLDIVQCGTITTLNLFGGDASRILIARPIPVTTVNVWATVKNVGKFLDHPFVTFTTTNWLVDQGEVYSTGR